ncbi:MAG: hypothetical protein IJW20_05765 [Clostridia bacterium]|nr:hypothetical protein [Clostridia bacterium]
MKNILKVTTIFLILSMIFVSISFATSVRDIEMKEDQKEILNLMTSENDDIISTDENTINSDLFLSEDSISVEENVNGNVYLIGEVVNVASERIDGNVFVLGNNVTINSNINGSIYVLGTNVSISGSVNDIYALAENMDILENTICRDIKSLGTTINISGIVNRDLYAAVGQVEIAETGKVNGILSSAEEVLGNTDNVNEIQIIEDATADIEASEEQIEEIGQSIVNGISIFFFISAEMTGLIIIALIVIFTSRKKLQTSSFKENGLMDTVYGLAYFGLAIAIIIALMFTLIGIPVSILLAFVLWFVFWKITIPVASIEIAKAILKRETKSKVLVWLLAFVIFTLAQCANFIPNAGGLIKGIISLYGFGYMIRSVIRKNKAEDSNEPEVEILA